MPENTDLFNHANIIDMKKSDFVKKRDGTIYPKNDNVLVLFYAPWCHWCNKMKPEWRLLADHMRATNSQVKVGAVNCDTYPEIATALSIDGFPTICLFTGNKKIEYNGERTKDALIKFLDAETKMKQDKLQLGEEKKPTNKKDNAEKSFFEGSKVRELGPENFDIKTRSLVGLNEPVIILFYAPWCYWCNQIKPEWIDAASKAKKGVIVAAVDCSKYPLIGDAMQVEGYPTIKLYETKSFDSESTYHGERKASAIVRFIDSKTANLPSKAAASSSNHDDDEPTLTQPSFTNSFFTSNGVSGRPVFVSFYSKSDYASTRFKETVMPQLAHKYQRYIKVGALDCDQHGSLCRKLGVQTVPACILIKGNEVIMYTDSPDIDTISRFLYDQVVINK
jgi:protein disulfide-isomerase A5